MFLGDENVDEQSHNLLITLARTPDGMDYAVWTVLHPLVRFENDYLDHLTLEPLESSGGRFFHRWINLAAVEREARGGYSAKGSLQYGSSLLGKAKWGTIVEQRVGAPKRG